MLKLKIRQRKKKIVLSLKVLREHSNPFPLIFEINNNGGEDDFVLYV